MCTQKFFRCKHCGNFVGLLNNAGVPMICCGEEMDELVPNTVVNDCTCDDACDHGHGTEKEETTCSAELFGGCK